MIILITTKFLKIYLPFGKNLQNVTYSDKISEIFNIKDHNFGMKNKNHIAPVNKTYVHFSTMFKLGK